MICVKCQKESTDDLHYSKSIKDGMCFSCTFWAEIAAQDSWIIEGHAYQGKPGIRQGPSWSLGFGGRQFYIEPFNGESFITNSLWHRGSVPEIWKDTLPDNAKFANGEGWEKVGKIEAMRIGKGQQ